MLSKEEKNGVEFWSNWASLKLTILGCNKETKEVIKDAMRKLLKELNLKNEKQDGKD
jgi:hypothetical protein